MPVSEADAVGHSWPSARGGAWPTSLSRDQASLPLTKGACLLLTWFTQQVPIWESISIHKYLSLETDCPRNIPEPR